MASPAAARTFPEYADHVFMPYIMKKLQPVQRVDITLDVYRHISLKVATREMRGFGTHSKVTSSSKIQKDWKSFLCAKKIGRVLLLSGEASGVLSCRR